MFRFLVVFLPSFFIVCQVFSWSQLESDSIYHLSLDLLFNFFTKGVSYCCNSYFYFDTFAHLCLRMIIVLSVAQRYPVEIKKPSDSGGETRKVEPQR